MPDNLKLTDKGDLLVGIPNVRSQLSEFLDDHPSIRKLMVYLPEKLVNAMAEKFAGGIRVDVERGVVSEYLFGAAVKTYFVTTLVEKNGKLYFGSLRNPTILVKDIVGRGSKGEKEEQS